MRKPGEDEFADVISARELLSVPAQPVNYCIPGRIPNGLVLIAGRPKCKKSWLAMQIAIAVAQGSETLGGTPENGTVLCLLLEDNEIRTRRRFDFFGLGSDAPPNLLLQYDWPTGDLGVAKLHRWMEAYSNTRVIVIDVLQRFRGARDTRQSPYEADYAMLGLLHGLAMKYPKLTILVVHHTRKGGADDPVEAINGTFGITGAVDAFLIVGKRIENERFAIHIDGRDWEAWDHDFVFEFRERQGWVWLGALDNDYTERQTEILRILKKDGSVTPSTMAEHFGISRQSAAESLKALEAKDAVYSKAGKYYPTVVTVP
jgi:RecA-family ATPase